MRQLILLAAFIFTLLVSTPGCQSMRVSKTAARKKSTVAQFPALAERSSPILSKQQNSSPLNRGLIKPASLVSDTLPPVPNSFVDVAAQSTEPETPTFDILLSERGDSNPMAESSSKNRWGHTRVSNSRAIARTACRDCDNAQQPGGSRLLPKFLTGWTQPQTENFAQPYEIAAHAIRIGDELEIKFPHKPLFSEKVMVREDGMIAVPLIPPVMAAGLTPESLQRELAAKYRALQYDPSAVRRGGVNKQYLLSVKDKLDVRFDSDNANSSLSKLNDSVTVRPDGKISLPLIGTLIAEGKTPEELEAEVAARYRKFYKEANPVLIVREFTNNQVLVNGRMMRTGMKDIDGVVVLTRTFERMVFVGGEVQKPGFIKFRGPMTVSQAIIAAGGPKRTAEMSTVARFREGPNCQAVGDLLNLKTQWSYEKQKKKPYSRRPAVDDMLLGANDVVIVPKTRIAKLNNFLDQYVYQLVPMTRNTQFQYLYTTGSSLGAFGF